MFPKKLLSRQGGPHQAGQGMADVSGRNAGALEELPFKGEDTEQAAESAAHGADAALAPGPGLRRYQVDDGDAGGVEAAGGAEVKIGRIGEDGEIGALGLGGAHKLAEFAVNSG